MGPQCPYPPCPLSFACSPSLHPSLHSGTSGSAFYHDNRQRFKTWRKDGAQGGNRHEQEEEKKRYGRRSETERGMDEVRRGDIRTDTVQQTESYGDIWRIHEAVMNLFGFFYRSARVSLMAK